MDNAFPTLLCSNESSCLSWVPCFSLQQIASIHPQVSWTLICLQNPPFSQWELSVPNVAFVRLGTKSIATWRQRIPHASQLHATRVWSMKLHTDSKYQSWFLIPSWTGISNCPRQIHQLLIRVSQNVLCTCLHHCVYWSTKKLKRVLISFLHIVLTISGCVVPSPCWCAHNHFFPFPPCDLLKHIFAESPSASELPSQLSSPQTVSHVSQGCCFHVICNGMQMRDFDPQLSLKSHVCIPSHHKSSFCLWVLEESGVFGSFS